MLSGEGSALQNRSARFERPCALQNPMDLGTVSQRLESNFYTSASAVADDICLVWHNCRAFNEPGSDVFHSCDELSGFFDQQWKQAKLPGPTVSPHPLAPRCRPLQNPTQ